MKLLFLDESGDHSLEVIDKDYPVFVLGGVIIDRTYYRSIVEPRIKKLKEDFFAEDVILHTTDIIRGKNGFEVLNDSQTRQYFYEELNSLMQELKYTVIACAIKKDAHLAQYGPRAADPYAYALEIVVERFVRDIGDVDHGGMIFAEKRRPDLDHELEMTWRKLRESGCSYASARKVDGRIIDLSLKDKRVNVVGLELADLVVSPIGRMVIGKPTHEDWKIVESKLLRAGSQSVGYGLKILPK
ncbi:MAG: DUF3800 domain-containing protein [Thermomicrobiales bacterium]